MNKYVSLMETINTGSCTKEISKFLKNNDISLYQYKVVQTAVSNRQKRAVLTPIKQKTTIHSRHREVSLHSIPLAEYFKKNPSLPQWELNEIIAAIWKALDDRQNHSADLDYQNIYIEQVRLPNPLIRRILGVQQIEYIIQFKEFNRTIRQFKLSDWDLLLEENLGSAYRNLLDKVYRNE